MDVILRHDPSGSPSRAPSPRSARVGRTNDALLVVLGRRAMHLSCPSCNAAIAADDADLSTLVAKCRRCDAVFSFAAQLADGAAPPRRRPALPAGLEIVSGEPSLSSEGTYRTAPRVHRPPLVISRRWPRFQHAFLLGFSLVWNAFLVVWYTVVLSDDEPALSLLLFPLIHVAVGAALFYSGIAGLINRTFVRVSERELTIRHKPFPWLGDRRVPSDDLRQLYVRPRAHRGDFGEGYTWDLFADTKGDVSIKLLSGLPNREQASYLEWAIEMHLGIVDDPSFSERSMSPAARP